LQATGSAVTSSFEFRIGNDDSPDGWRSSFDTQDAVPLPEVHVHAGQGVDGADRVLLVWANGALPNHHWLQVRLVANAATGLEHDDVFYFGLAIGDTGADNVGTRVLVNVADAMGARKNPVALPDLAAIDNLYDFDRDRDVDQNDQLIARNHPALFNQGLVLISPPAPPQPTVPQPMAPILSPAAELDESPLWASPSVVDAVEPEVWTAPSAAVVEPTASRDATRMRAALAYLFDQWETERRMDLGHDWFGPDQWESTSPTLLRWQPAGRTFLKR
jgi:hypothetical protein